MSKLIDKDALVAEIEKRRNANTFNEGVFEEDIDILSFIDTLEVKDVDFGTKVYKYVDEHFNVYDDGNQTLQTKDKKLLIGRVDVENIAKHFFELGLKVAQNNS